MRKKYYLLLSIFIFCLPLTAQIDYGIKAGTGNYDVNTTNIDSNGSFPLSIHIGGFLGLQLNESFGTVLNISYNNSEESYGF